MIDGLLLLGSGVAAGIFGSLLGLGGGTLIVPLLTLAFGLPLIKAVGVSLVCVIMTSGAAAGVYLERRTANLRLGMTLELFTAVGALVGGLIAFLVPEHLLEGLFAALLGYTAFTMARRRDTAPAVTVEAAPGVDPAGTPAATPAPEADSMGSFVASLSGPGYRVHRFGWGIVGSLGAGLSSALLGIGGGL